MSAVCDENSVSWLEIDLGAIRHNFRELRRYVAPTVQTFAVVKADAYGHGAIPVARALLEEGAAALCVARVSEAAELRAASIGARILVFTPPLGCEARRFVELGCEPAVCAVEHVEALAAAARTSATTCNIHIKVDVGMGRLGVAPAHALEFLHAISRYRELRPVGVFSHLPCADMPRDDVTSKQIAAFRELRATIETSGFSGLTYHLANSAAVLDHPSAHFDAVRPGISLYGQLPSLEVRARPNLRPAMSLKTRIVFLKRVPSGTGLSYGHTFVTQRESIIATIALGYADGYPRHASNRTHMIVCGREVPQVGRVCMDFSLLDVTDVPEVSIGEEVLAFGTSGSLTLPAEKVAADFGTIGYELTTRVGRRLPRVYL